MYNELTECHDEIANWDTILFSLFYHDIIYNASKKDNEEKSVDIVVKRLVQINYHSHRIDFLYKPGRKKVLQHFLDMENIFKTEYFRNKYENTARTNIRKELSQL